MARKAGRYQIALWANDKPLGDSPYAIHISAGTDPPAHPPTFLAFLGDLWRLTRV
jgi:hypothetical protein